MCQKGRNRDILENCRAVGKKQVFFQFCGTSLYIDNPPHIVEHKCQTPV